MSTASADAFQVWDALSGAYVDLKTSIVGNAPAGLDTLQGIAASINNDPVFSVTVDTANDALANDITSKAPRTIQLLPEQLLASRRQWWDYPTWTTLRTS